MMRMMKMYKQMELTSIQTSAHYKELVQEAEASLPGAGCCLG